MHKWNRNAVSWVVVGMILLSSVACAGGERVRNGDADLPLATQNQPEQEPTVIPSADTAVPASQPAPEQPTEQPETPQPTAAPLSPTATLAPAESGPSDQVLTQGAELESMLDELDRMNQAADSLEDVP